MKKKIFLFFCCAFLPAANAFAENIQSAHFIICSDLDPCFVQFITANAEAYYENMQGKYFSKDWQKRLTIYYSRTQSDTQQLLDNNGHNLKVDGGFYEPNTPAVYTHRLMNNEKSNGLDSLFREILLHFIHLNYRDSPAWFEEGLACFLSEQTGIVKGKLKLGRPNPWREQKLRNDIEQGRRLNIKRLLSSSTEQFYGWDTGYHFARAFFYWLHETGRLEQYLKAVRNKGYELEALEEILSEPYGKINTELKNFIETDCYAGAYLEDGRQAKDETGKIQAFQKALELKPDYLAARLELAECYYGSKDYEKCRENLKQILDDPESIEYQKAAGLLANTYYSDKDYSKSLEYYTRAWEYSDYYEYKYRLAYQIANCYYHLKDTKGAQLWYQKFLDCNWEPESRKTAVDYAQNYIKYTSANDVNQTKEKKAKADSNSIGNKQ